MSNPISNPANHLTNLEVENKYLKITLSILREKMEALKRNQTEIIQQTKASSHNDTLQLQSMVNTLRVQLETSEMRQEKQIQLSVVRETDQNNQLKNLVQSLRQKLEIIESDHRQEFQKFARVQS